MNIGLISGKIRQSCATFDMERIGYQEDISRQSTNTQEEDTNKQKPNHPCEFNDLLAARRSKIVS